MPIPSEPLRLNSLGDALFRFLRPPAVQPSPESLFAEFFTFATPN